MFDLSALADATVQVEAHGGSGSGFHYLDTSVVVTNFHVVAGAVTANTPITVRTSDGDAISAAVIASSPTDVHDFAVLRLDSSLAGTRTALTPGDPPARGEELAFAGFPHGIPDLLTHRAFVSGPAGDHGFHLDGSVNGGNSGGPIVDQTGSVVGVVTQRRYIGGQHMDLLARQAAASAEEARSTANSGSVRIMGFDFGATMAMMGDAFALIANVSAANANSGIGIGYHIQYVAEACNEL